MTRLLARVFAAATAFLHFFRKRGLSERPTANTRNDNTASESTVLGLLRDEVERRKTSDASAYRQQQRKLRIDKVALAVASLTMVAVGYYAWLADRQLGETRKLLEIATRQLEMTDRPWLAVSVVITEPLRVVTDDVNLIFAINVKNIGKAVATHVESHVRVYPQPFAQTVFTEPMRQQAELCEKARKNNDIRSRLALFPTEEATLPHSAGLGRREALRGRIIPVIVGCVQYRYKTSLVQHQTRFIYQLSRHKSGEPMGSAVDFLKPNLPLLSELHLDKYFFGGHDAD